MDRDSSVLDLISRLGKSPTALKVTSKGMPGHPLYLPGDSALEPYSKAA